MKEYHLYPELYERISYLIPSGYSTAWRTSSKSFFYNPLRVACTCYFSSFEEAALPEVKSEGIFWEVVAVDAEDRDEVYELATLDFIKNFNF